MEKLSYIHTESLPSLLLDQQNQAWTSVLLWNTCFPNLKLFLKLFTECITVFQPHLNWPYYSKNGLTDASHVHQSPSQYKIYFGSATALLANLMFIWLPKINYTLLSESLLFKNKSLFLDFICLTSLFYRAQLIKFHRSGVVFFMRVYCVIHKI